MTDSENSRYWDRLADDYQQATRISSDDFHFGPLLPGNRELGYLPELPAMAHCLEIGCGAAQNSIFLANCGHVCTALDSSAAQLAHGRRLAAERGLDVGFVHASMQAVDDIPAGPFDLVHSVYALPFSSDPERVVHAMASRLRPGGTLLLATAHPVFAGEWVELDEGERGMFLVDYFHPPADARTLSDDDATTVCRPRPLSEVAGWILAAGLQISGLYEPRPLPIPLLNEEEIRRRAPYDSDAWRELYEPLAKVPVVAVFVARRPA